MLTVKPTQTGNSQKQYGLPNIHGDTLLTANAAGTNTSNGNGPLSSFGYDPFGVALPGSVLPANTTNGSYGWVGQHQKMSESAFTLTPIQMGARVYIPGLGRFLQVDPIEGGTENNYVYPLNPISRFDLTGEADKEYKSRGKVEHLSRAEADALTKKNLGMSLNKKEQQLVKSALLKQKKTQKFLPDQRGVRRNNQKRDNYSKKSPKSFRPKGDVQILIIDVFLNIMLKDSSLNPRNGPLS